jgi:hypothetical protein
LFATRTQSSLAFDFQTSSSHNGSVKSFSGKSQAVLADRWDHSGFDQLEQENRTLQNKSSVGKPRREKRPDRQLYNVRQRVNQTKPTTTPAKSPERLNCSVIEKIEESSPYLQTVKDVLKAFEYKEVNSFEDDRLSVSNVSTAISERLKGIDEESYIKSDTIKEKEDSIEDIEESPIVVLFDMMMETPNGLMNLRVHEGDDYEQILEKACIESSLDTKTSLHFKINLLQTIANMLDNPEEIHKSVDALLDLNYQLLMNENCLEELDQ